MTLAVAIGKGKSPNALKALTTVLAKEEDYRVKCNIIRALANFSYENATPLIYPLLKDKNNNVSVVAAQYFWKMAFRKKLPPIELGKRTHGLGAETHFVPCRQPAVARLFYRSPEQHQCGIAGALFKKFKPL